MWVMTEDGKACNLSHAYRISAMPTMKGCNVIAEFLVAVGTNDEHFTEFSIIKSFDGEFAAEKFIADLVTKLNR